MARRGLKPRLFLAPEPSTAAPTRKNEPFRLPAKSKHNSEFASVSSPPTPKPKPAMTKERLRSVLPAVWELMRPRRGLLALGFLLMIVNRVSGLVLPYSTKFLIDGVIANTTLNCCGSWFRWCCWPR